MDLILLNFKNKIKRKWQTGESNQTGVTNAMPGLPRFLSKCAELTKINPMVAREQRGALVFTSRLFPLVVLLL